jgi:hypothetical protein
LRPEHLSKTGGASMTARYFFHLRDGQAGIADLEGTELPDRPSAQAYAIRVARELMRRNELKARAWKLEVCDRDGNPLFALPFAAVDPTLDHLTPPLRETIERLSDTKRDLAETVFSLQCLWSHQRQLQARMSGAPYLAAQNGRRL